MQLILTDGTTTLDLNDTVNYGVTYDQWAPAVGGLREDVLGGYSPYVDVSESIPLHVRGATGAAAMANLAAVGQMLDQAERWARGERVAAVQLWYMPTNSTLGGYLKAVVLGRSGGEGWMGLSPRVNDAANYEIPGVTLEIKRTNPWLMDSYLVENYCRNSSFEAWDGSNFANWTKSGGVFTLTQSTSHVVQGSSTARMQVASPNVDGIYQDIALTNGVQYTITAQVYVASGAGRIAVYQHGSFTFIGLVDTTGTGAKTLTITATAAGGGLRVALLNDNSTSDLYWDAVMVEAGTVGTDYHPNSTDVFVAIGTAVGNPEILTADFTVSGIESEYAPCKLVLDPVSVNATGFWKVGAVVVTVGGEATILEAEDLNKASPGSGTMTATAVAAARGGEVLRIVPVSAGTYEMIDISFVGQVGRQYAVLGLVKNGNAIEYTAQVVAQLFGAAVAESEQTIIGDNSGIYADPTYHYFGSFTLPRRANQLYVNLVPASTSGSGGLDVDFLVVVEIEDEQDKVIELPALVYAGTGSAQTVEIDPSALVRPVPRVYLPDDDLQAAALGDLWVHHKGLTVDVLPLLNKGARWLYTEGTTADVADLTVTVTRMLAFLTPR